MKRLIPPPEVMPIFGGFFDAFLKSLFGITSAHGSAIAQLESRLATGASYVDNFNRQESNLLGNGWVQGGTGQGLGIIDFAARLNNHGISTGIRYAICPQLMSEDNHSVAAIVNPAGVMDGCPTALFVRANADLTEFVYANVWKRSIQLGRGTRNGNSWKFNDWKHIARGVQESDTVELVADGSTYKVIVNRTTVVEYTDTAGYPVDASHRTVGFSSETRFQGIIPNYSWGLANFVARSGLGALAETTKVANDAHSRAAAAHEAASDARSVANVAQTTANGKPNFTDIPTNIPLWQNINAVDDPTFPLSQLVNWTRVYGGDSNSSASSDESTNPDYTPKTRSLELGFIRATRDRNYSTVGMITGRGGWGFDPQSFTVAVFKMDPGNGNLSKVWDSGDVKNQITSAGTQFRLTMPTIRARQGDVHAVGVFQISPLPGTSNRPLACVHQSQPAQPPGVYPRNIYGYIRNLGTIPDFIKATDIQQGEWIPWFVLG
ncbi:hypothetical protein D5S18_28075 [Nocardia panacis]|uniref:Uncharacterized protein n=1 Tax=Nocardia panacis TaxID=2340916 RepID=A0A3A4K9C4_9NOCA|nr:hypothetical protein [Nocardia panacis]RJO69763.1 hypothetical protein D5S18_28075 [Nocardia panacis]